MIERPLHDLPIARGSSRRYLATIPVACCIALSLALAWFEDGSVLAADWLPYAVFAALLLAATVLVGPAMRPSPRALVGLAALLGLAVWTGVSAVWSPVPSLARDEALLIAFYAVVLTIGATTLRTPEVRRAAVGIVALGGVLLAVGVAVHLVLGDGREELVSAGRLGDPIEYPNALAALFLVAFWPAIVVTVDRSVPIAVRAAALGGATTVLAAWLATQSKGGGLALALSGILFFAVARPRLRPLLPVAIAGALVGAAYRPLTAPFRAGPAELEGAIQDMGAAILLLAAAASVIGLLYVLLDRRLSVGARVREGIGAAVLIALAAAALTGVVAFFVEVSDPPQYLEDKWEAFKTKGPEQGSSHLVNIGSNRYDFWRVGLREFRDQPVQGEGGRGFGPAYLRLGHTEETPARSHSLEVDVLGETGIVGFALLALAIVAPLTVLVRRARFSLSSAAILAACVYWLLHASGDRLWTFPAAGLPFFVLLGVGLASDEEPLLGPRVAAPVAIVAAALALLAFAPPWLSARFTEQARETHSASELRWARRLDPLSTEPYLAEAALAAPPADVAPLRRAVELEPERARLHYRLALALRRAGRRAEATRELQTAHRLSPRDPLVRAELSR
jgi:O-antigen ligase